MSGIAEGKAGKVCVQEPGAERVSGSMWTITSNVAERMSKIKTELSMALEKRSQLCGMVGRKA